ncbi:hypothetical protein GCM10009760_52460 [Kitasatospora kazusensis]|uniref:Uncharacterized protein n=1 Tax=Kitasatospora kazusensis TaxID=407974 RepID=A0ABN3A574_9ACTN
MKIHATDLPALSQATAALLGDHWTVNANLGTNGVTLSGPDGRRAGILTRTHGLTLQLWVTGFPAPELPDDANQAAHNEHAQHLAQRLQEDHHYHAVLRLNEITNDVPAAIIALLDEALFPACHHKPLAVGHRPWLDAAEAAEQPGPEATVQPEAPITLNPEAPTEPNTPAAPKKPARSPRQRTTKPTADATPAPAETNQAHKAATAKADPPKPSAKRTKQAPATT